MGSSTPKPVLYIVTIAIAVLSAIGLGSLCFSLFVKTWADPSILTAIITLTSGLSGALTGMLMNTRQPNVANGTTTLTTPATPDSTVTLATEPPKPEHS